MPTIASSSANPSPQAQRPLTTALREGTVELHREAERAGIMRDLLRGRVDRGGYCSLLRNLRALYRTLETGLTQLAADPVISQVSLPALARGAALASDLDVLHGGCWEAEIPLAPAMARYVERLDEATRADPVMLVAHAYVRYLGDLSGGQIVRRAIASALALTEDSGQSFYRFSEAPQVLAARLRSALDSIVLTPAEQARLVDEARLAFRYHIELFEELRDAAVPPIAR